jgi:hypothetical protein
VPHQASDTPVTVGDHPITGAFLAGKKLVGDGPPVRNIIVWQSDTAWSGTLWT